MSVTKAVINSTSLEANLLNAGTVVITGEADFTHEPMLTQNTTTTTAGLTNSSLVSKSYVDEGIMQKPYTTKWITSFSTLSTESSPTVAFNIWQSIQFTNIGTRYVPKICMIKFTSNITLNVLNNNTNAIELQNYSFSSLYQFSFTWDSQGYGKDCWYYKVKGDDLIGANTQNQLINIGFHGNTVNPYQFPLITYNIGTYIANIQAGLNNQSPPLLPPTQPVTYQVYVQQHSLTAEIVYSDVTKNDSHTTNYILSPTVSFDPTNSWAGGCFFTNPN